MNDEIVIQAMKESDIDQVIELWNKILNSSFLQSSVTKEELIQYIERNPDVSSVACADDGKVIGVLLCGHDGIRGFIYHIAVHDEYKVNEITNRMLERSLSKLKEAGIKKGFIFTQSNTHDMDETFNSIGWVVIPNKLQFEV
ncbi:MULTISPECIES: GNAT family N-acetyltransferase [unclassified Clostridium]|uniref:GNAT family N-acetyltransferase n=1 Tax=unclassified Clostridium TaxID=2614128 RepID=UPI0002976E1F|nr:MULTISPECIES: GNAT family N-acetyltransferase [unclassified Clostridium]EKQ53177.1 MAG: acetyltransferase, N-acetylglutamate synthase [Clostridium sp. Maddingley MBC34-26]